MKKSGPQEPIHSPIPFKSPIYKNKDEIQYTKCLEKSSVKENDIVFSYNTPNDPNLRSKALFQIPSSLMSTSNFSYTSKNLAVGTSEHFQSIQTNSNSIQQTPSQHSLGRSDSISTSLRLSLPQPSVIGQDGISTPSTPESPGMCLTIGSTYSSEMSQVPLPFPEGSSPNLVMTPSTQYLGFPRRTRWFQSPFACFLETEDSLVMDGKVPHLLKPEARRRLYRALWATGYKIAPVGMNGARLGKLKMGTENLQSLGQVISCQGTSTYPRFSSAQRAGDPIADYFSVDVYDRVVIASLSDGCNWGEGPRIAAFNASKAFNVCLGRRLSRVTTVRKLASLLLRGFASAHASVISNPAQKFVVGTTTLLGGVLVPLGQPSFLARRGRSVSRPEDITNHFGTGPNNPQNNGGNGPYLFVVASIGDCKAFIWYHRTHKVKEITTSNRENTLSPSDCGGRLGTYIDGQPDLRNLKLYCESCEEGDIIFLASDGVYDNCDPEILGLSPGDVGLQSQDWAEVDPVLGASAKLDYRERLLEKIISSRSETFLADQLVDIIQNNPRTVSNAPDEPVTAVSLVKHLTFFCQEITRKSREFMEQFPDQCLPEDYSLYPGKMDHTSVLAFSVCSRYRASLPG